MIPLERRLYTYSSEIFEDFDWERVIFIHDVQRTTYEILLKNIYIYFPKKNQKSVTEVLRRIELCVPA
jgi:hypothetical protein